ncbi:hypothetical protein AJ79_09475 [Helicocarpus griseus UAMH5409]|uniref:SRR1-like domain-containing protein n=1 Tax=Helicocarpus griseus UAMH5409 TaxID=1447875 RepID=A0A2B7WIY2_9EURO|nr:hypothetical protein AJ79_09475 [Helicocarpus griseus UAMH5409]
MHICHEMERQDKETGNVLPGFVSQPIEVVEDMLKSTIQIWETTESCKRLRTILTAAAKNNDNLRDISKIVGFAFGDISSERKSDSALAPPRSYFQHALLLTLRDVLLQIKGEENSNDSTDKLRCFVQDPSYQDVDDQVLKKSGITILEDPDGFLETDDSTAVLSFAPNVPVRQIVCDIARPALIIWDTVKPEKKTDIVTTDPDSNRLREMVNDSYDMFEFQDYERRFGNVAIYIRRPSAPAAAN